MISWVTKREYNTLSLHELYDLDLLTDKEYDSLISSRNFLWKVRYAIHLLAKRKEDRLLLEHQQALAKIFGYHNDAANEAVEQFMHQYYQVITTMERMSELLLGIFRENILPVAADEQEVKINDWCIRNGNYIEITNPNIFLEQPHTLLELFNILQTTSGIRGLVPRTIRLIHSHLHIINDDYRAKRKHKEIFMQIMSESHGITYVLRRMNRYGILAAWIPAFANIVGRMQFDLFHAYTVDDHTLRVIRMMRRNSVPEGAEDMPYESLIFKSLPDPKILYLAGLFHDIAKGRGGSHSELGAVDAYDFCRLHHLDYYDSHLVSWLVENHLLFSMTAQQRDISDPEVIQEFAQQMMSSIRLDYLYLLTIADIRGTNANLWNGWKHSLLQSLHKNTRRVLKHSLAPSSSAQLVEQKRESILEQLPIHTIDKDSGDQFCKRMGDDYLLNHSVDNILWQMSYIQTESVYPLIQLRQDKKRNTTALFIYTHGSDELFAQTTVVLGKLNINVVAAYIMQTPNGFSLETLHILDQENQPLTHSDTQTRLINALREEITSNEPTQDYHYRMPRLLKAFDVKTQIHIEQDHEKQQTRITLRTIDVPGLLAKLSRIFYELEYRVVGARITTLGEEAEDIFYLTDFDDKPVVDEKKLQLLHDTLIEKIDNIEQK
ncbi:MAG: [protein-PII] uridylyltransferase, partial [Thiotrichaceae bacterium]